jgi:integrase
MISSKSVSIAATLVFAVLPSPAITFKTLVSFDGTNGIGANGPLVQGFDGNFYGTTYAGGDNGEFGRVLDPEEKRKLQATAAKNPDWENAYLAMTLTFNTTMRACEVKGLQWRDVDFMERTVTVRHSKTDAGKRLIPLNDEVWQAILALYQRAQKIEATEPKHYVFPACENGHIDPTTAQKSWRSAWRTLKERGWLGRLPIPRSATSCDY